MNANVRIITPNQLKNKQRKLKTAAVYASLNLRTNWNSEKPIYYNKPTWDYYMQMKHKMLYWPYPYNTTRNPDGMYTKEMKAARNEMNKHLNMIRRAVAYKSRGAPSKVSGIKKRKVGNRSPPPSPPKSPPKSPRKVKRSL